MRKATEILAAIMLGIPAAIAGYAVSVIKVGYHAGRDFYYGLDD